MKTQLANAFRLSSALVAGFGLSLALIATAGCGGPGEPNEADLDRVPKVQPSQGRGAPSMGDVKKKKK